MSRSITNLKNFEDSLHSFHGSFNGTRGRRRNSLAANLHSNLVVPGGSNSDVMQFARRRLSNVGDVVSRKLSRTIGWKPIFESVEETVSQSSALCTQYIRNRLKRSGIYHRKGLKRMRSSALLPDLTIVKEASPVLIAVGTELEKDHPGLYVKIGRQVGCGCFTDHSVSSTMTNVSREIIRHGDVTWSKIIAIYAVAGGISVDCVRQGKPEFLPIIQKVVANIVEKDLATWIETMGGWSAFVSRYRLPQKTSQWDTKKLVLIASVISPIVIWLLLRFLL